jgi:hypothetical protein
VNSISVVAERLSLAVVGGGKFFFQVSDHHFAEELKKTV